jgi:hypothetical protein
LEIAKQTKRGGQLNQPFDKRFIRLVGFVVKTFPNLVAFEKPAVIKQTYALSQPSVHKF